MDFVASLPGHKVLDNGAAEGELAAIDQLSRLLDTALFHEVVIPDKLTNYAWTLEAAKIYKHLKDDFPHVQMMAVVQGSTLAEITSCYNAYLHSMPWIDVIGLPRVLNEQFGEQSRLKFVESFQNNPDFNGKPIHCLGAYYNWPEEIRQLKHYPIVRSMDSSMPYVYGLYGMSFDDDIGNRKRPDGYFDIVPDKVQEECIIDNVVRYIKWAEQ